MAAMLLLSGCAFQPELTVIAGPRRSEGRDDTALTFMLLQRVGQHGITGCVHQSEGQHGRPFNSEPEETFDTCGFGGRWGGKPR
jgi:hypothetical protein